MACFSVRHYVVIVETGTEENSGTEATVHITLFGTLGDSGKRYLVNNKEQNKKFRTGKVGHLINDCEEYFTHIKTGKVFNVLFNGSTLGLTTPNTSTLTKEFKVLPIKMLQL